MAAVRLGVVAAWWGEPMVMGLVLERPVAVGDEVAIVGELTAMRAPVAELSVEGEAATAATVGDRVGIRLPRRARVGDVVHRVLRPDEVDAAG